jgi:hypothetical protein
MSSARALNRDANIAQHHDIAANAALFHFKNLSKLLAADLTS